MPYLGPDRNFKADMARLGLALAFRRYSQAYVEVEDRAREHRAGVWAGAFVPPWDWRGKRDQERSILKDLREREREAGPFHDSKAWASRPTVAGGLGRTRAVPPVRAVRLYVARRRADRFQNRSCSSTLHSKVGGIPCAGQPLVSQSYLR